MKKRLLIKDWTPEIPSSPHHAGFKFSAEDPNWNTWRRVWLEQNYPNCENWRLAKVLNIEEDAVQKEARRMRLKKSKEFVHWEKCPATKEEGVPAGFHWETDEEYEKRRAKEREQDQYVAIILANTYDFCTPVERRQLAQSLMEAMEWGRDTQPDLPHDFEYWN